MFSPSRRGSWCASGGVWPAAGPLLHWGPDHLERAEDAEAEAAVRRRGDRPPLAAFGHRVGERLAHVARVRVVRARVAVPSLDQHCKLQPNLHVTTTGVGRPVVVVVVVVDLAVLHEVRDRGSPGQPRRHREGSERSRRPSRETENVCRRQGPNPNPMLMSQCNAQAQP